MDAPYPKPSGWSVAKACFPDLKNKVVIVTGSSSGIGAATAVAFIQNGSKVALHGRNVQRLQEVHDFCIQEGATEDQVFCVSGNMSDEGIPENIIKETLAHYGQIDILINNAGGSDLKNFDSSSTEFLADTFNDNVKAVYHLTKLALPHLKKSKGSIVFNSSVFGKMAVPNSIVYGMVKSTIDMFAKSLALDLAKDGVRVNIVSPGAISTGFFRQTTLIDKSLSEKEGFAKAKEIYDIFAGIHPIGRCGWSEEVAQAILFLASNVSAFVTGHDLLIDGGALLTSSSNYLTPDNIKTD